MLSTKREFSPPQANLSQARVAYHSYRACTCQCQPYSCISTMKEQHKTGLFKNSLGWQTNLGYGGGSFLPAGPGLFLNSSEFSLCIIGSRHVVPTHYSRKPSSYHATFLFCSRASYSTNAAHINPANSLATAVVALQGILPLLTSLR